MDALAAKRERGFTGAAAKLGYLNPRRRSRRDQSAPADLMQICEGQLVFDNVAVSPEAPLNPTRSRALAPRDRAQRR